MDVSQETKKNLRKRILQLLRNQKEEDQSKKSLVILEKLLDLPEFQHAKTILFYASFDGEVDTLIMMQKAQQFGKKIALPQINKEERRITPALVDNLSEDLETGPYGIRQPSLVRARKIENQDLDLVLVPGVAFDRSHRRLGRGGGYYDRFLAQLPEEVPTVGLAFDFQMVECLPHEKHDHAVRRVIVN